MRRLPPSVAVAGYSPNRLLPLSSAPVLDQGQRLTDIQAIQRLFANGEQGGYWSVDPAYLYEDSAGTTPASMDGVVGLCVNRITGLPNAIQNTTANKPCLRKTKISNKYWLDSNTSSGALTATFSGSLGSACTTATVGAEGVTIAESQTVDSNYNIARKFGYNGDILIINRALTAVENALVTRVLGYSVPLLGCELISNGSFDTDVSSFTANSSNLEWENGAARNYRLTVGWGGAYSPYFTIIAQYSYFCKANLIESNSECSFSAYYDSAADLIIQYTLGNSVTGKKSFAFYSPASDSRANVCLVNTGVAAHNRLFDDVSVKAIL